MRTFRRVLDLDATNGLAYQNIATLQLKAGEPQTAESSLRKALQIDDTLHGVYTTLGVVLSETGRKADAVDMWQRALAREDSDYDVSTISRLRSLSLAAATKPAPTGSVTLHPLHPRCIAQTSNAFDASSNRDKKPLVAASRKRGHT